MNGMERVSGILIGLLFLLVVLSPLTTNLAEATEKIGVERENSLDGTETVESDQNKLITKNNSASDMSDVISKLGINIDENNNSKKDWIKLPENYWAQNETILRLFGANISGNGTRGSNGGIRPLWMEVGHKKISWYAAKNLGINGIQLPYGDSGGFLEDSEKIDIDLDGSNEIIVDESKGPHKVGKVTIQNGNPNPHDIFFNSSIDNNASGMLSGDTNHCTDPDGRIDYGVYIPVAETGTDWARRHTYDPWAEGPYIYSTSTANDRAPGRVRLYTNYAINHFKKNTERDDFWGFYYLALANHYLEDLGNPFHSNAESALIILNLVNQKLYHHKYEINAENILNQDSTFLNEAGKIVVTDPFTAAKELANYSNPYYLSICSAYYKMDGLDAADPDILRDKMRGWFRYAYEFITGESPDQTQQRLQKYIDDCTKHLLEVTTAYITGLYEYVLFEASQRYTKEVFTVLSCSELYKSVNPGGTAQYEIVVKNTDSLGRTIYLTVTEKPSGWTTTLSHDSVYLSSGDSTTVTLTVDTTSSSSVGDYRVVVNGKSSVETRGDYLNLHTLVRYLNLISERIEFSDAPEVGRTIAIKGYVNNRGVLSFATAKVEMVVKDSSGNVEENLWLGDIDVDSSTVDVSEEVSGTWTVSSGVHYVELNVDSEYTISESDEDDNVITKQIGWGLDTRLTFHEAYSRYSDIVIDSNNDVHVVWADARDDVDGDSFQDEELYYTRIEDCGRILVSPERITTKSVCESSYRPRIANDSLGNIHLVWNDVRGGCTQVYYKKIDSNGNTLISDTRVPPTTQMSFNADIAVDCNDDIHICWIDKRSCCQGQVYYRKQDSNGNILIDDKQLSSIIESGEQSVDYPSVCVNRFGETNVFAKVVWLFRDSVANVEEIRYAKISPEGVVSPKDLKLTSASPRVRGLESAETQNDLWITWINSSDVMLLRKDLSGGVHGPNKLNENGVGTGGIAPSIVTGSIIGASHDLHISWVEYKNGRPRIMYTRLDQYGIFVVHPVELTDRSTRIDKPRVGVSCDGDVIYVTWTEGRDGKYEIYYKTTSPRPDLTISSSDISLSSYQVNNGDQITISAEIYNAGSVPAYDFNVSFYVQSLFIENYTVASINPGSYVNAQITWVVDTMAGDNEVAVIVDPQYNDTNGITHSYGRVIEGYEGNNNASTVFTVKVDVDISYDPPSPVKEGSVKITVKTAEHISESPEVKYTPYGGTAMPVDMTNPSGDMKTWIGYISITSSTGDGTATVSVTRTDVTYAPGTTILSGGSFVIDTTPPTTSHSLSGTLGENGWYMSPVTVTLSASDSCPADTCSGVAYTKYQIDSGSWQTYISPFQLGNGIHTVKYYSVDNAGNEETPASFTVKIDTSSPIDQSIIINNNDECTNSVNVFLDVSATDTVSDVNQMHFSNGAFHNAQYYLNSPSSWADHPKVIESPHPYSDGYYNTWEIYHPGAFSMRVHFTKIDTTETGAHGPQGDQPFWCKDVLYVKDKFGRIINEYENYYGEDIWSSEVPDDKIILEMKCYDGGDDPYKNGWGFKTDKYQTWEDHMYPNNYDHTWTKTHNGALKMKVHFTKIDTQTDHDFVYIYDKDNNQIAHYTGYHTDIWTPIAYGDTIKIRLKTDSSVKGWGFKIDQYSYYVHGTWSTWEVYQTTKEWILPEGDGKKAVYFQTKDTAGNIAGYVYDTIILDTGLPVAVHLLNPTSITSSSMVLEWTENEDSDFQRYELHKSTTPGFTPSSSTLYKKSTDVKWLKQKVTGLSSSTTYYFKVRVYDMANGHSDSNEVSGATKSSSSSGGCPFVFIWNGTGYAQENNILPGSEDFERDVRDVTDYYKIEQDMVPKNGVYSLQIGEFETEYTNLNQLELMAIDHTNDVYIAITKDGVVLTYRNPIEALSAIDRCGNDYLAAVNSTGGDYYEGYEGDYLIIDFGNPNTTNGAKLVLRTDLKPQYNLYSSLTPQLWGSIKIQILNKTQLWKDVYIIEPRDKWAIDIVDLSPFLDEMSNESFKIRLYWTNHHKVDYVGLDTSQQVNVSAQTHSIISAFHSSLGDVTAKLLYDDENYTKIMPGDYISVEFPYTTENNETRDVILVSKGYYYTPINNIDISQDVKVTLNVDGTVGNTVEMIILESTFSDGYSYVPIAETNITVGVSGNSVNTIFKGYANRSYEILLRYITTGTGINPVSIELEYNDIVKIKNFTFNASEGIVQEKYINIDNDLNETLYESDGQVFTKVGVLLNMEPSNLMRENDIFGWENIVWDFGDGTNLTTTNRTVTHEYETPGTYLITVTVTYDDGTTVTETKEIVIS